MRICAHWVLSTTTLLVLNNFSYLPSAVGHTASLMSKPLRLNLR